MPLTCVCLAIMSFFRSAAFSRIEHLLLEVSSTLTHDVLHLFAQVSVVADSLLYGADQVGSIVEEALESVQQILLLVHYLFYCLTSDGLDTANTSGNAALGDDANHTDATCALGMAATTELYAATELYNTYLVAILLAEEGNGTQFLGFLDGSVAIFLQGQVLADTLVNKVLYLADLLGCNLLEV